MTLARKIDGTWQVWNGVNEPMTRTLTKANLVYADGRSEEIDVASYQASALLTAANVEGFLADGTWSEADLDPYGLKVAVPFTVPEGKRIAGALRLVEVNGTPHEDFDLEDIPPPPPPPTAEEKLAAAGLTVAELRQLLGLGAG